MKFLPYAQQSISVDDIEAVKGALQQPVITRGELVETFEKEMAAFCDASFAVAFNSGTAALQAAFAVTSSPNDIVVTTPNTFVSTVGSAVQIGVTPVFVDIDTKTGNLNPDGVALNINRLHSKGKTIIAPVHFAGIPVDMQAIDRAITDYKTVVIEDAAQAFGSCYADGSKVGSCKWSQMTIFSFHPAKILTTGEGGMVTTNDEELSHRLKIYRNNGIERDPKFWKNGEAKRPVLFPVNPLHSDSVKAPGLTRRKGDNISQYGPLCGAVNRGSFDASPSVRDLRERALGYYEAQSLTGNYNFTEMQAALGLSQLKRLDSFIAKRQMLVDEYRMQLSKIEHLKLLEQAPGQSIAWHLLVAQIDFSAYKTTKIAVMESLREQEIGTQVHYIPVYRHPIFAKRMGDISEYFPENEKYYREALSLPLYFDLEKEDVERVATALKSALLRK